MSTEVLLPRDEVNPRDLFTQAPAATEVFPAWFRESQAKAWTQFEALPLPARGREEWRFTNLKALELSAFGRASGVDEETKAALITRSVARQKTAARLIFANDQLLTRTELPAESSAKGVIFTTLEAAAREHGEILRKHFMAQEAILGGQKFAALHQANVRTGTFLYVPRNVEVALPLEVFHWLAGENASVFPHTLIVLGEHAKVTLVENFESADERAGFACGVNDLYLAAGAKLTYVCVQNWNRASKAIQINNTTVDRDASAISLLLNLGSQYARSESVSRLAGAGSRSDMLSVSVADGAQEFDQRTFQIHQVPNTTSDLLYKNSLDDTARTIFSGLIRVEPGAHKTDAYQKVRNLLLSDDAEANSAPGLEIEADDVRCTHGATSGQIEGEELFYLLSRGITRKQAQKLIVLGFLNEVFERLGDGAIAADLRERVEARFAGK